MSQFSCYPKIADSTALGQQAMAASLPVAIASDQSAVPVSGTITVSPPLAVSQSGIWTVQPGNTANTTAWKVDGSAVTQPVSAAALPLPSGAATSANQSTEITSLGNIDTSTSAMNAKFGSLGQKAMAGSAPVVIASDQSAVPASQSGTWNINNVSGTVSLPTGASTLAKQPALGTAGSASADVISVQGIASMTPLSVNQGTPTAVTVKQAAVAVGTSAVRLTTDGSAPSSTRVLLSAIPDSTSTAKFYIGDSSVANSGASRGLQILAGQSFTVTNDAGNYYIISDTTAQTVYVLEQE